ncbi:MULTISPECIES: hypothetical protein [Streptacidiphilus]|uniref:DUF5666 domain-containing protein n=1 Tax=Streptacidiphilus cavernicola TaxID=3342716 RepID=A0ABV6UPU1_9ACTN|nr:hypothetical protein [Streptacidiphilus jeojiense]
MIEEFEEHDGGVSEAALIGLVGSAFDEGRRGREVQDVLARGRALRRRRRAMPALGALGVAAASVSLVVALTGPNGAGSTAGAGSGQSLTADGAVVNVDEAGFSVHTDAKTGEVTVTLHQLFDESELQALLAKAGVPTAFHNTTLPAGTPVSPHAACTWTGAQVLHPGDVISSPRQDGNDAVITIDPSKMPARSVLGLAYATIGQGNTAARAIRTTLLSGEPTGCTTT